MKVLLSWLREFAPIEGDPVALAGEMSDLGMAVESMDVIGEGLEGIVVARVLELREHPDADRVQLVDVDAGDGEALQIGCGAFNMAVGDLVPLATIGTVMPNGMEIARRKLRGEWSNGMLCSPTEIGLGEDAGGILILPEGLTPGTPLTEALEIESDVLYDLEINPNRPDAMSVAGVARDLAARLHVPFAYRDPLVTESSSATAADLTSIELVDPDRCGRFLARVLQDVTVGPSPTWLANRLTALGMRPINNIVDISNYVMLELGHPSHTYDLDLVAGAKLGVRAAKPGERVVTLDEVSRELQEADTVIVDGDDEAIGIAGVMGGASTEISEATTNVLLEVAWWPEMMIARTSSRLRLRSEASMRFERGTDPFGLDRAVARFCELAASTGASVTAGVIDERGDLPDRPPITVRTARVNAMLGTELAAPEIQGYLEPIGFTVEAGTDDAQVVEAPGFRPDVTTEIDVIEEVARHHGYANIAQTRPPSTHTGGLTERQRERRSTRWTLEGLGLSEAMPNPFLAPADLERSGIQGEVVTVTNPLAAEESVLRPSLRPGLLGALAYNARHRNHGVALYEIGHTFRRPPEGQQLPDEREELAGILGEQDATAAVEVWKLLVEALALTDARLVTAEHPGLHPTRTASIVVSDEAVGHVGEIDPVVVEAFDLGGRAGWFEVDLGRLLELPHGERQYRSVSRFPSSDIDLAFEVDETVPAAAVEAAIVEAGGDLLFSVKLFDVFRGGPVVEGRRSLAYSLRFQARDRTLTDEEVGEARSAIVAAVEASLPANLRG